MNGFKPVFLGKVALESREDLKIMAHSGSLRQSKT